MDYPKSVPGVGLVDGKFVDEDPVNGTPGSLIPAQWGNDVTEEILNVVREVGGVPAEGTKNQLVAAIWKMFREATAGATELLRGVLRVGTQAEVNAGALDDVVVTPKKLRMGFAASFTANGYIAFPTWLGGFIIQWGGGVYANDPVTFPIQFPSVIGGVVIGARNYNAAAAAYQKVSAMAAYGETLTGFTAASSSGGGQNSFWLAVGK